MHAHHASTLQIRLSWTFFGLPWVLLSRFGRVARRSRQSSRRGGARTSQRSVLPLALSPHSQQRRDLGAGFVGVGGHRPLAALNLLADESRRRGSRTLAPPRPLRDVQYRVARRRGRSRGLPLHDQRGVTFHGHRDRLGDLRPLDPLLVARRARRRLRRLDATIGRGCPRPIELDT